MKNFLAPEHSSHFRNNNIIELEGLFSEEQAQQLQSNIDQAVMERLKIRLSQKDKTSSFEKFKAGRDLWRNDSIIRKAVTNHNFLETVATLTDQKTLRLGYTQFIQTPLVDSINPDKGYVQLFNRQSPIEGISCLQGIVSGAIIALKGVLKESIAKPVTEEGEKPALLCLPSKPGNVTIFNATAELDLSQLLTCDSQSYLLVVFTEPRAVYVYRELDPNTHFLKSLGYNLSDRLNDRLHPIVYRR